MDGILIAVEGIDGAGKTTQVQLLGEAMREYGEEVVLSKEPTNGEWGQKIRHSAKNGRMSLEDEIHAFKEDRKEHVRSVIGPALADGKTVILDRYFYSFLAYQGARGGDPAHLQEASAFAPIPDLVILLDIDPRISLVRITDSRGEDPNHFETVSQLDDVRDSFLRIFRNVENGVVLDGSRSVPEVQRTIANILLEGVLKKKRCAKSYGCDDPLHCEPKMTNQCEWAALNGIKPQPEEFPALIQS